MTSLNRDFGERPSGKQCTAAIQHIQDTKHEYIQITYIVEIWFIRTSSNSPFEHPNDSVLGQVQLTGGTPLRVHQKMES